MATGSSSSRLSSSLPAKPHQPWSFHFPKKELGRNVIVKRCFQPSWFVKWPWVHYNEAQDSVFCFTCIKASSENKIQWASNSEAAFITAGFSNWKDASAKFAKHQSSSCHRESMLKTVTLPITTGDVGQTLSAPAPTRKDGRSPMSTQNLIKLEVFSSTRPSSQGSWR